MQNLPPPELAAWVEDAAREQPVLLDAGES